MFLSLMWQAGSSSDLTNLVTNASSHTLEGDGLGDLQDIISF